MRALSSKRGVSTVVEYLIIYGVAVFIVSSVIALLSVDRFSSTTSLAEQACIGVNTFCQEVQAFAGSATTPGGVVIYGVNDEDEVVSLLSFVEESSFSSNLFRSCSPPVISFLIDDTGFISTSDLPDISESKLYNLSPGANYALVIECDGDENYATEFLQGEAMFDWTSDEQFVRKARIDFTQVFVQPGSPSNAALANYRPSDSKECEDGIDNNNDGRTDGNDFSCQINANLPEGSYEEACNDGRDNDFDGWVDLNDIGCTSLEDTSEINVQANECANGLDDDGDGLIDGNDPDCLGPSDDSEGDGSDLPACNDGFDNDNDGLTDYPLDPGCSSVTDGTEENSLPDHNFLFSFSDQGYLETLTWISDTNHLIVEDESQRFPQPVNWKRSYLHNRIEKRFSNIVPISGWGFTNNDGNTFIEDYIDYAKISETQNQVIFLANTSSLEVRSSFTFVEDTIVVEMAITNLFGEPITTDIPVHLGSMYFSSAVGTILDPNLGGVEKTYRELSRTYPHDSTVFSPVIAKWGGQYTLGVQAMHDIQYPQFAGFDLIDESLSNTVTARSGEYILPNRQKRVRYAFTFAEPNEWESALDHYIERFSSTQIGLSYCVDGTLALSDGHDQTQTITDFYDEGSERYTVQSRLAQTHLDRQTDSYAQSGVRYQGILNTQLASQYLTTNPLPVAPTTELIDPSLDIWSDNTLIQQYADRAQEKNVSLMWYFNPCADIAHAAIVDETTFTQGTTVSTVDLTLEQNRTIMLDRLRHFADEGITSFFVDAQQCPGKKDFLRIAQFTLSQEYGMSPTFICEGLHDSMSLDCPQYYSWLDEGSPTEPLLTRLLTPESIIYLHADDTPSSIESVGALSRGLIPTISEQYPSTKTLQITPVVKTVIELIRPACTVPLAPLRLNAGGTYSLQFISPMAHTMPVTYLLDNSFSLGGVTNEEITSRGFSSYHTDFSSGLDTQATAYFEDPFSVDPEYVAGIPFKPVTAPVLSTWQLQAQTLKDTGANTLIIARPPFAVTDQDILTLKTHPFVIGLPEASLSDPDFILAYRAAASARMTELIAITQVTFKDEATDIIGVIGIAPITEEQFRYDTVAAQTEADWQSLLSLQSQLWQDVSTLVDVAIVDPQFESLSTHQHHAAYYVTLLEANKAQSTLPVWTSTNFAFTDTGAVITDAIAEVQAIMPLSMNIERSVLVDTTVLSSADEEVVNAYLRGYRKLGIYSKFIGNMQGFSDSYQAFISDSIDPQHIMLSHNNELLFVTYKDHPDQTEWFAQYTLGEDPTETTLLGSRGETIGLHEGANLCNSGFPDQLTQTCI